MKSIVNDEPLLLSVECKDFRFKVPLAITGKVIEVAETVRLTLTQGSNAGRGEAMGVDYLGDDVAAIRDQLAGVSSDIPFVRSVGDIQDMLPPGGARNALDCAYWDLLCKQQSTDIWTLLDIRPKPITTVFTLGISEPETMAMQALHVQDYPFLKLKLSADRPVERVEAVRRVRPDAKVIVDVNQGWGLDELREYAPSLGSLGVMMIEQPLPRGEDESLAAYRSPLPLGADESCLHSGELEMIAERYDVINVKLDKTGGLTEAMKVARMTKDKGLGLMVGNMGGSSLAMAPSTVIGQLSDFVDIDGPLLLERDIESGLEFMTGGIVNTPSPQLWG